VDAKVALLRMHEIDSMYDKVRRRIISLRKAVGGSTELTELREQVESIDAELNNARSEQQDMELESRSLTDRIRESEKNLMSGELSNPRELEALQTSIDSMKSLRTELEDKSVERLVLADSLQGKLKEKQEALAELEQQWDEHKTALETETDQRKKEYVYLRKARVKVSDLLSPDNLELYEHLRRRKNGVAVARLEEENCGACHTQVAIGILNNVRYSDELLSCPSCGRILLTEE
jgi:predicted  nucleic acid-binding Zn-ribbon protein